MQVQTHLTPRWCQRWQPCLGKRRNQGNAIVGEIYPPEIRTVTKWKEYEIILLFIRYLIYDQSGETHKIYNVFTVKTEWNAFLSILLIASVFVMWILNAHSSLLWRIRCVQRLKQLKSRSFGYDLPWQVSGKLSTTHIPSLAVAKALKGLKQSPWFADLNMLSCTQ